MRTTILIGAFMLISTLSCKNTRPKINSPAIDPAHIGIILDSAAYFDLLNDKFLTQEFAQVFVDTSKHAEPLIEMYLTGQEAFLNVGLAKGFWKGKAGKGIMMFQTRKPGQVDILLQNWKKNYSDSLESYVYDGDDFKIAEVTPYINEETSSSKQPNLSMLLASYTLPTYKKWGFSDSAIANGITMKTFMNSWDSQSQTKLFKKFKSFQIQVTADELRQIESGLISVGYTKSEGVLMHTDLPSIYFTVTAKNEIPKYTKIVIELAEPTEERTIQLGTMYTVYVKGRELVIEHSKNN